jgi:hypothetical protein
MNWESEPFEKKRNRVSRIAAREGYLSLLLVGLGFCDPLFSLVPESLAFPIGITMLACSCLLAISGVRQGTGMDRAAAAVSLAFLTVFVLILAMH